MIYLDEIDLKKPEIYMGRGFNPETITEKEFDRIIYPLAYNTARAILLDNRQRVRQCLEMMRSLVKAGKYYGFEKAAGVKETELPIGYCTVEELINVYGCFIEPSNPYI